jgi:uncharacterized membrane protein
MAGTKKTKYDTNPLDPEFPDKAGATQVFGNQGERTQNFPPPAPTEDQTRRFASGDYPQYQQQTPPLQQNPQFQQYQQPYGGYAPMYHPGSYGDVGETGKRKVAKVGLSENIVSALPYIPWYFGMVAGIILLFLLPRTETKARFHAAQGLAVHVGILLITTILGGIGNITGIANAAMVIFQIVMTVMLSIWTIKAWKGKPVHIETVDSLTNWLDEKIDPKLAGN